MYTPTRYLTLEVLASVLAEFEWPAPYTLDDWLPDGIAVLLPKCTIVFVEGFESEMGLEFLPENTGATKTVTLKHALHVVRKDSTYASPAEEPALINDLASQPSVEKVKNGLRDLCALILAYVPDTLSGDFRWAEAYRSAN